MILGVVFMLLLVNVLVFAQPPSEMTYQGYLTDNSNNAITANLQLTFNIYDVQSGGSALWTEVHPSVAVIEGVFRVRLGSITSLGLGFDIPYWLGIQVDSDPELAPRIALSSSAYSFNSISSEGLQGSPVASTAPASGEVLKWDGSNWAPGVDNAGSSVWTESGDDIYNSNSGNVGVGTNAPFTKFHVLNPSLPTALFSSNTTNDSVQISFDEAGNNNLGMFLLYDGSQDELEVFGKTGGGSIGPHLTIDRDNGRATFFGDVDMPADAIEAVEIADEPGVVQEQNNSTHSLTSTVMVDIETITITIPAAGYIVLDGRSIAWLGGVTGSNQVYMQIDETAGGSISGSNWTKAGLSVYGSTANSFFPMYTSRTYFKNAGTYTFRLEAAEVSGNASGNTCNVYQTLLRAVYYPTSYGNVITTVLNPSGFEDVETVQPNLEAGDLETSSAYQVNLRELEIKALKARLAAEKAEYELEKARSMDR